MKVEAEPELYFTRKVELAIIRIVVKTDVEFTEDMAEGEEVGDEEEGPQDGALGHTGGDWGGDGHKEFELNELSAVFEVGVEPAKGDKSDAKWGEFTEEDGMVDGVKNHAQVKEDENGQ